MVRDSKNLFLWEDWEIRNTLYDIERELRWNNKKLELSDTLYLGVFIGVFSGFFGSMLFSFFLMVTPETTSYEMGFFLLIAFLLMVSLFTLLSFRWVKKKRHLEDSRDALYSFTPEGQKRLLEALKKGKTLDKMSIEEHNEMMERSGFKEVEPNHWTHKSYLRKWKKERKQGNKK